MNIDSNYINKTEINKLFANLKITIDEKIDMLNCQMVKTNEDLNTIKNNQSGAELQSKGGIDYIKGISNI